MNRTVSIMSVLLMAPSLLMAVSPLSPVSSKFDWDQGSLLSQFSSLRRQRPSPAPIVISAAITSREAIRLAVGPLHCSPIVIAAFKKAWKKAGSGEKRYEAGFRIDRVYGGLRVVFAPMTYKEGGLRILIKPGVTIAIAHTHPKRGLSVPSPNDVMSPVPNYIISHKSLYLTDPAMGRYRRVRGGTREWADSCAK